MINLIDKIGLSYDNVILKHNRGIVNSRSECNIKVKVGCIELESPVFLSNMRYLQEPNPRVLEIFNKRRWGYIYHRLLGREDIFRFVKKINEENWHFKSISVGIQESDRQLLLDIVRNNLKLDCLTIDVAFIYNENALEFTKWVRNLFPDVYLIAGNFDRPETALELEKIGVNCGKFGIGVSAKCKTRQFTSIGTTIISDLVECKSVTNNLHYLLDGGLKTFNDGSVAIGDCWKGMNFGGHLINSASLFQRVTELADEQGEILCYGNSTSLAKGNSKNVEGTVFKIKTDGKSLEEQMDHIMDSARSFCSYAGINDINNAYNSCDYRVIFKT